MFGCRSVGEFSSLSGSWLLVVYAVRIVESLVARTKRNHSFGGYDAVGAQRLPNIGAGDSVEGLSPHQQETARVDRRLILYAANPR